MAQTRTITTITEHFAVKGDKNIGKVKKWLVNKYLPAYAKETMKENEQYLQKKITEQAIEIKELKAYINGLENGIKAQRKIVINNRGE